VGKYQFLILIARNQPEEASPVPDASAGIFLHSGFRAASTWFWSKFRNVPGICAYYEPLHEHLVLVTPKMIVADRPDRWASGHPPMREPYNVEYSGLLRAAGGVERFEKRFAYETYYLKEDDAALRAYIYGLIDHARRRRRVPVFGFCRSLGRVQWFKRNFPGLHIVTLRDPWDQWSSIAAQSERGNFYFEARIYRIACIGRHQSPYRDFFDGLILPRPVGEGASNLPAVMVATSAEMRLRIFLRVYLLDMLLALSSADVVVDLDQMSSDSLYRGEIADTLRAATGLAELDFADCALPRHPPNVSPSARYALAEAQSLLDAQEAGPATKLLRAKIAGTYGRFLTVPCAEDSEQPMESAMVFLVVAAAAMVAKCGDRTEEAMQFLRECFDHAFDGSRDQLAVLASLLGGKSRSPDESRAARLLHRALTEP
jgi:hypothetical protein